MFTLSKLLTSTSFLSLGRVAAHVGRPRGRAGRFCRYRVGSHGCSRGICHRRLLKRSWFVRSGNGLDCLTVQRRAAHHGRSTIWRVQWWFCAQNRFGLRQGAFDCHAGVGEAVAVGRNQTDLIAFGDKKQAVEVVANVLHGHGVLHAWQEFFKCFLRQRQGREGVL